MILSQRTTSPLRMAEMRIAGMQWQATLWMIIGMSLLPQIHAWSIEPIKVEYLWQSQPTLEFDWAGRPIIPNIDVTAEHIKAPPARERMSAAQSILRAPNSTSLNRPAALKALLERLTAGEPHPLVRTEMFASACELDDGQHAEQLWKLALGDLACEAVVERACILWRNPLPLDRWRKRLSSTTATEQELLHAIDGLGATGSATDVTLLEAIVLDGTRTSSVRLRSARAIGNVASADQRPLAEKLRASSAANAELLAVEVLAKSPVASSTEFVQDIALHGSTLAGRAAYRWLCQHDAATAQRLVESFLKHTDAEVRLLAIEQLTIANTQTTVPVLFETLRDENPNVRAAARVHLLTCCSRSEDEKQRTLTLLQPAMTDQDWRVLEQSIRLTVELAQPDYRDRLMTLVEHARPEVCITAAWALRHLADDEATLQRMLAHIQALTVRLLDDQDAKVTEVHLRCMAHMFDAFGHRKFEPAKETCLQYVPKNFRLGLITRMSAVWACGKLWENGDNKKLLAELHARIADKEGMFPELASVRFAATIALGWIADPESREPLITCDETKMNPGGYATEWALQRIDQRQRGK